MSRGTAVVTGASSGIGEATARALAAEGFSVVIGARRVDRLQKLAADIGGVAHQLDVTDLASVEAFCGEVAECRVLVNNAGGAFGVETVVDADEQKWRDMYEVNVMGTVRMTKALWPKLVASGAGQVINITSIAGVEAYPTGGGYNASKFAQHALTDVLRQESIGDPVRISEVRPGAVETEFSVVRMDGDKAKADAVYAGMTPLAATDVAETIAFIATRPDHVNIAEATVFPQAQAKARMIHRTTD